MQHKDGASWVEARIEEFVGQVADRLQQFPAERCEAAAREVSEHLRAVVSARRACGLGPAQAWAESCIGTLWMGWNFLGMGWAMATCVGLIVFTLVAARHLK